MGVSYLINSIPATYTGKQELLDTIVVSPPSNTTICTPRQFFNTPHYRITAQPSTTAALGAYFISAPQVSIAVPSNNVPMSEGSLFVMILPTAIDGVPVRPAGWDMWNAAHEYFGNFYCEYYQMKRIRGTCTPLMLTPMAQAGEIVFTITFGTFQVKYGFTKQQFTMAFYSDFNFAYSAFPQSPQFLSSAAMPTIELSNTPDKVQYMPAW